MFVELNSDSPNPAPPPTHTQLDTFPIANKIQNFKETYKKLYQKFGFLYFLCTIHKGQKELGNDKWLNFPPPPSKKFLLIEKKIMVK